MFEMGHISNDWIRWDLPEVTEWELDQHRLTKDMVVGIIEHKALLSLYRYPYQTLFSKHWKQVQLVPSAGNSFIGQHGPSGDKAPTYKELINGSTHLASDVVKCPALSKVWLGLIECT